LWQRFLTAYGSPHFFAEESVMDTYRMAQHVMQGEDALVGFDVDNADYIVSFGAGIIEGWGSPVRMFKAHSTWQDNNVKVIQFEPRLSNTAAKAAQWVSINAGTEAALALGMAHVIMRESLHNAQFTRFYSDGFVAWQKQVMEAYDPDSVSALTGVAKETIVSVAREFARAKKPLALFGRGRGDSAGGLNECLAAYALNAIVGNINKPGGIWTVAADQTYDWPDPDLDDKAQAGIGMQRIDGAGSQYPLAQSALNQLPGLINQAAGASPLQMLFVSASNPAYALPGNQAVKDALEKIPYIVSCSSYMDETALMADLILPNHVYLERLEDVPVASGYNRPLIGLCKPVIAPLYNTMHTGDVILALAKGAGDTVAAAFEWESYEECLEASMGDRWDALSEEALWEDTEFTPPTWNTFFSTASGKFEFPKSGSGPAIAFTPLEVDGDAAAFPLTLIPYDSMRIASGYIADTPFMIKSVSDKILKGKDIFVEINPQTARSLGLSNGQLATLSTPLGEAKVKVQLYEGLMPGVVAMPRGLGHTAPDPFIADKGVNYNQLVGPVTDKVSGLDAAWGIRAKLARA
jgi:anaerobic selenocysteine-containing dehydrogenase